MSQRRLQLLAHKDDLLLSCLQMRVYFACMISKIGGKHEARGCTWMIVDMYHDR